MQVVAETIAATVLTLIAFMLGKAAYRASGQASYAQPIVIGIAVVIACLLAFDIPYPKFDARTEFIDTLLGTATVALAIPLYKNLVFIRQFGRTILLTIAIGALLAPGLSIMIAALMQAPDFLLASIAPKSITTPMAISVSQALGGIPALSAAIVIVTGIIVAIAAEPVCLMLGISHPAIVGTLMGLTGHGIATARAVEMDSQTAAFAALSMGLTGVYTSTVFPFIAPLFLTSH